MQNKKLIPILVGLIVLGGATAFVAGRMLNNNVGPLGLFGIGGGGGAMEISLIPAKELPDSPPDTVGLFAERADNIITVQTTSLKTGGQGIVVHQNEDGSTSTSPNMEFGPEVEVVLTNETIIYLDTTERIDPDTTQSTIIQQTVKQVTLNDLSPNSYVNVWGRKSGDRIIAEIVLINAP